MSSDDDGEAVQLFSANSRKRARAQAGKKRAAAVSAAVNAAATAGGEGGEGGARLGAGAGSADAGGGEWRALGLSPWLCATVARLGMVEPTAVQRNCIPATLAGCNLLASAPTGSGKTAAFALPILEALARDLVSVFAVVVTPTRELAFQIAEQFQALGVAIRLRCEVVVGGVSLVQQQDALATRPHVVVATPGRLRCHVQGPSPPALGNVAFVVLDEADRLLEPSFAADLGALFKATPATRQTLLYSATLKPNVAAQREESASKKRLFEWHATPHPTTPGALDERYLLMPQQVKPVYLAYALRRLGPEITEGPLAPASDLKHRKPAARGTRGVAKSSKSMYDEDEGEEEEEEDDDDDDEEEEQEQEQEQGEEEAGQSKSARKSRSGKPGTGQAKAASAPAEEPDVLDVERARLAIVFASSCKNCELIGQTLIALGVNCSVLHSGLTQNRRLAALGKFRARTTNVLVATDVASRGLDIPQVDLVINYDVPHAVEDYVHRVGRTARQGRTGLALTFVTQYDLKLLLAVEAATGSKLRLLPGVDEDRDVLVLLTRVANAGRAARTKIAEAHDAEGPQGHKRRRHPHDT